MRAIMARMDPQEPFIRRPEATALLVIDMQNDFLRPGAPVPAAGGLELVPVVAGLARRARQAGAPVIFTQEAHRPPSPGDRLKGLLAELVEVQHVSRC